jgi:hypothetical protein
MMKFRALGGFGKATLSIGIVAGMAIFVRFTPWPYTLLHTLTQFETTCDNANKNCVTLLFLRERSFDSTYKFILTFDEMHYSPWWPPENRVEFDPDMAVELLWEGTELLSVSVTNGGQDYTLFGELPLVFRIKIVPEL